MKINGQALALVSLTGIVLVSILSLTMNVSENKIGFRIQLPWILIETTKSN